MDPSPAEQIEDLEAFLVILDIISDGPDDSEVLGRFSQAWAKAMT
jgi:hypothetical protein